MDLISALHSCPLFICAPGGDEGTVPAKVSDGLGCLWSLSSMSLRSLLPGNCCSLMEVLLPLFLFPLGRPLCYASLCIFSDTLRLTDMINLLWGSGVTGLLRGCGRPHLLPGLGRYVWCLCCFLLSQRNLFQTDLSISLQGSCCCFLRTELQASCASNPISLSSDCLHSLEFCLGWVPVGGSVFSELQS